jgi:hypothetical protein
MNSELKRNTLTSETVDRFSIVLMAGIAAEALEFGQAEGGASDEQALISLLSGLSPAWSPSAISMQARWAVLQAILLLRENHDAYSAVVAAMTVRAPLGDCVDCLEQYAHVPPSVDNRNNEVIPSIPSSHIASDVGQAAETQLSLSEREAAVVEQLQRIKEQLADLDS